MLRAAGWYVAHPDLTVRDIRRLKNIGKAVDEFLDKRSSVTSAAPSGTGGVSYLNKALELRFFPELWTSRTSM